MSGWFAIVRVKLPAFSGILVKIVKLMKQRIRMRWIPQIAEEPPRLTPEQWQELQRQVAEQQWVETTAVLHWLYPVAQIVIVAFTLWMLVYCIRNDSDRQVWLWILLCFPLLGASIYFFARWLPSSSIAVPAFLRRWTESSKIRRLQAAADQIGNPYQHIELGDALSGVMQFDKAELSYRRAIEKEPNNLPALWGLATVQSHLSQPTEAKATLESILKIDPGYKFGDVSLSYGRTLQALHDQEAALNHWRAHIKRWRQPEALCSMAQILIERQEYPEARLLLQQMISDIDLTPRALARKVFFWKSRGIRLMRSIPER